MANLFLYLSDNSRLSYILRAFTTGSPQHEPLAASPGFQAPAVAKWLQVASPLKKTTTYQLPKSSYKVLLKV